MRNLFVAFLILCTASCSFLDIKTTPVEKPRLDIQNPAPLQLQTITIRSSGKKDVAMSVEDYKKLLINLDSIQAYVLSLQDILNKYREYYEPKK